MLAHTPQNQAETYRLTLSPDTVGKSVSGELAVILCAVITPGEADRRKWRYDLNGLHRNKHYGKDQNNKRVEFDITELTCGSETFNQCMSQLARSNESNTHPVGDVWFLNCKK